MPRVVTYSEGMDVKSGAPRGRATPKRMTGIEIPWSSAASCPSVIRIGLVCYLLTARRGRARLRFGRVAVTVRGTPPQPVRVSAGSRGFGAPRPPCGMEREGGSGRTNPLAVTGGLGRSRGAGRHRPLGGVPLARPVDASIPRLARLRAQLKGALVTTLEQSAISVINTHPLANTDGDWSEGNRFAAAHRAQLGALARAVGSVPVPAVVCGDFNDAGRCVRGAVPPTFRAGYLPPGRRSCRIDFIPTAGEVKVSAAESCSRASRRYARRAWVRAGPRWPVFTGICCN